MQVIRVSWIFRVVCYLMVTLVTFGFVALATLELFSRWRLRSTRSAWIVKSQEELQDNSFALKYITKSDRYWLDPNSNEDVDTSGFSSAYIVPKGKDSSDAVYTRKLPLGDVTYKKVGFFDPLKENQFLLRTDFTACEYSKCKMTGAKEAADAMIFLIAKLKHVEVPRFKRSHQQFWVLKSDEAPSRFSWFETLKRPGLKDTMNWTLTHKADSDIPVFYGKITEKEDLEDKDYSKIFDGKTKKAAWFVSHCPVRSRRGLYVEKMTARIDVDIFGKCGTRKCGMAEKQPGVFGARQQADKEMCFPMLSADYFFYLAFENSLCQEYITEKFFKMFHDVDIVPVVRGGADYKKYFPPNSFVDASDFATPESLADFLRDLSLDKDRYIGYLRTKNRYRYVPDHPEWQCKLCEKLHTDPGRRTYEDVHAWWTRGQCHDAMDSVEFY